MSIRLETHLPLCLITDHEVNILLVEDEFKVSEFIKKGLNEQCHQLDVAYDGLFGEKLALENDYDQVILDVILPGKSGLKCCTQVQNFKSDLPFLNGTLR